MLPITYHYQEALFLIEFVFAKWQSTEETFKN